MIIMKKIFSILCRLRVVEKKQSTVKIKSTFKVQSVFQVKEKKNTYIIELLHAGWLYDKEDSKVTRRIEIVEKEEDMRVEVVEVTRYYRVKGFKRYLKEVNEERIIYVYGDIESVYCPLFNKL